MIEQLVEGIPKIKTEEDSYYIGEDGLKYCSICNEALETLVHWPWGMKKETSMCKCQTDKYNADMAALKTDETSLQILRYTSINRKLNPWITDATFEKDNGSQPKLSFCREYASILTT